MLGEAARMVKTPRGERPWAPVRRRRLPPTAAERSRGATCPTPAARGRARPAARGAGAGEAKETDDEAGPRAGGGDETPPRGRRQDRGGRQDDRGGGHENERHLEIGEQVKREEARRDPHRRAPGEEIAEQRTRSRIV